MEELKLFTNKSWFEINLALELRIQQYQALIQVDVHSVDDIDLKDSYVKKIEELRKIQALVEEQLLKP